MTIVYKIVTPAEWEIASKDGVFGGSAVDLRDGFVHLSTGKQVEETVARHFSGEGELMLLAARAEVFGDALRWEASRGGDLFPHLYADLPVRQLLWAKPFDAANLNGLRSLIAE